MPQPLWPEDLHNAELLSQVHPPNWINPQPKGRYNLVVIGGGSAGLVSAAGAARNRRSTRIRAGVARAPVRRMCSATASASRDSEEDTSLFRRSVKND